MPFFLLAALAGFGYSFQSTMLAHFGRRIDPFLVTVCRNLSFIITLSPLLLLAPAASIMQALSLWPFLLLAGLLGTLGFFCTLMAQRFFPVGIVTSAGQMLQIWLLLWAMLLFGESVSIASWAAIILIIAGVVFMMLQKNHMPHLDSRVLVGLVFALLYPLALSLSIMSMLYVAKHSHPLAAAYFWEVAIGLFALLIFLGRKHWCHTRFLPTHRIAVSWREALLIALITSTTLLGSGLGPMLMTAANPGVVEAVMMPMGVITSVLLAWAVFRERLLLAQWLAIGVVVGGVMLLKLTL